MRLRTCLRQAAMAAAAAVALASAGAPALAAGAETAVATAAQPSANNSTVVLINGDRLTIRSVPVGRSAISDLPGAGGDSLISLREGSAIEEIPADALPYLGRGLDPSLFDVAALRRAEASGRLPVRMTFHGSRPDLPGVTVTRGSHGSAEGYLTTASARVFGAALLRQFLADHARGSYGGGLFAGGTDIALPGAPAPPVQPDFPMHTLTITGSNLSGKPDTGDIVWVFDATNLTDYQEIALFYHGVVKLSVPAGHYWVIGEFDSLADGTPQTHLVFPPQFAVARNTAVHVAEQAARSEITMATARPAGPVDVTFTAVLGDRLGSKDSIEWFNAPGAIWVSPMGRRPAVGTLQADASMQLTSPSAAAGLPYAYNLNYADPAGTIPAQHYRARPSDLAAITNRYYQDVPSAGAWTTFGAFPNEGLLSFTLVPLALPGEQIQYFSTAPDLLWSSGYNSAVSAGEPASGGQNGAFQVLHAGERLAVDWNRYPLHPQPDASVLGRVPPPSPLLPSAIRSGNTLTLTVTPFSDNQPGHLSAGSVPGTTVTESYQVDQNGVPIASGNAADGVPPVALSSKPSVVRFTLDAARTGASYLESTSSHTVWTWRSRPRPDATVPSSWYCAYVLRHGVYVAVRACAVQPMMTLDYQVRGLALDGTARPGLQLITVHVGHIQLAGAARITGAAVRASCDGGKTWQPAAVRQAGAGTFRAAFSAPPGCAVTLRVAAADAAGDSIAERVYQAYRVAG